MYGSNELYLNIAFVTNKRLIKCYNKSMVHTLLWKSIVFYNYINSQ